ncbi:hypothetical protein [Streptomyces sp. SAJ15]|uniref:hypothetical protein n=1 Tax=Streptomyces sp. SAJ15 TaxID=2011095 RepID=UPI001185E4FE|nr:hypothetical protein [Streptomyces sp. SAJ15]TVL89824.1 hypothetical protein CD790_25870 [Streptomyces sp. SAJ15]
MTTTNRLAEIRQRTGKESARESDLAWLLAFADGAAATGRYQQEHIVELAAGQEHARQIAAILEQENDRLVTEAGRALDLLMAGEPGEAAEILKQLAADPIEAQDDNRRPIYLDGNSRAWISCGDGNIRAVEGATSQPIPAADIRTRTGSLREIGRTW